MGRSVLVAGGAGFLGSAITEAFVARGDRVTVVDGLFPKTGGRADRLQSLQKKIDFVPSALEAVEDLPSLLAGQDLIVDAMAWTSHHGAMEDPFYDLELNLRSHLFLLKAVGDQPKAKMILLGSRGQFGRSKEKFIGEDEFQEPVDIQGIHKTAAESYFRVYSRIRGLNVCALRLPNCFGPGQPTSGGDIGLIGGFIRDLMAGKTIEVFGGDRVRAFAFSSDVASLVVAISDCEISGFQRLNVSGTKITIGELVRKLHLLTGSGAIKNGEAPASVKNMEIGSAIMSDERLRAWLPEWRPSDFDESLGKTLSYFKREIS